MRVVTFVEDGGLTRAGVLVAGGVVDLAVASEGVLPSDMVDFIAAGEQAWQVAGELAATARDVRPLESLRLASPIPRPRRNVFAVGQNYIEHVDEGNRAMALGAEVPTIPVFFSKATIGVLGPDDSVLLDPAVTTQLDWEAELAVVIGRRGRDIPADEALAHVFGCTAGNDLSARDLQFGHGQWFKGKSIDGACALGPCILTTDEVPDVQSLDLECRVNGEIKQKSNTAMMIFSVARIIESLSLGLTLEPGDVIMTGTPAGVGFARTPPEYLEPGDVVDVEIETIGVLRNFVVAARGRDEEDN